MSFPLRARALRSCACHRPPSRAQRARACHAAALRDIENIVGADALSLNESVIANHGSLERGYVGWNAPQAVVYGGSTREVSEVVRACAAHRMPIVPYGAGTSVEGHIDCPLPGTVMLDLSRMDAVLEVNEADFELELSSDFSSLPLSLIYY